MNNFETRLDELKTGITPGAQVDSPIRGGVANLITRDQAHTMGAQAHEVGIRRQPNKDADYRALSKGVSGKASEYLKLGWLAGWDSVKGAVS